MLCRSNPPRKPRNFVESLTEVSGYCGSHPLSVVIIIPLHANMGICPTTLLAFCNCLICCSLRAWQRTCPAAGPPAAGDLWNALDKTKKNAESRKLNTRVTSRHLNLSNSTDRRCGVPTALLSRPYVRNLSTQSQTNRPLFGRIGGLELALGFTGIGSIAGVALSGNTCFPTCRQRPLKPRL
jgi:hypothetical protein